MENLIFVALHFVMAYVAIKLERSDDDENVILIAVMYLIPFFGLILSSMMAIIILSQETYSYLRR